MRWLSLLISFLVGKYNIAHRPSFKEAAMAVIEELAYKSRKPVAMMLGGLILVLILCGGIFMSAVDLAQQYDREGVVRFTASTGTGLTMVLITLILFAWVFLAAWPGTRAHTADHTPEAGAKTPSSLEQALATLVLDFVKERELKREQAHQSLPAHSPESGAPSLSS